jgi:hypothetical protein
MIGAKKQPFFKIRKLLIYIVFYGQVPQTGFASNHAVVPNAKLEGS